MSIRDNIRTATLGQPKIFKKKIVTVNGHEIEVRQPSVGIRRDLYNKCRTPAGEIDPMSFSIWSVIKTCFVPNTDERIFIDEDYDKLVATPTGGFLDKLSNEATEVMAMTEEDDKKK